MCAAYCGMVASAAATWDDAWRMAGSVAKVAPGAVGWISTFSVDALSCAGAYWRSTRSACPAWPELYSGRFLEPSAWPAMKMAATRSSQPKTAVLRCAALQPATRSVRLGRSRRRPGGGSCSTAWAEIGNTELCGWRIGVPLCWRRWVLTRDGRDGERLRERVDVEAPAAGAVRAVRVVAEVVAVVPHAVDCLPRRPVPDRQRDPGEERPPDREHDGIQREQRDEHADQVGDVPPGGGVPPPGPQLGHDAGADDLAVTAGDGSVDHGAQPGPLDVRAPADRRGGGDEHRQPGQRDAQARAADGGAQRDREQHPADGQVAEQVPGASPQAAGQQQPDGVAAQAQLAHGAHPTSRMSCSTALTCSASFFISPRRSVMLDTASSASLRTTVSAVTRISKGTSSKYFIALPSSDSSSCPVTRPAFSSRSRCMYSSGLDMPSRRASSLTCTRPPASSAMICSRSGCAIAVSMATSSSLVRVSSTLFTCKAELTREES